MNIDEVIDRIGLLNSTNTKEKIEKAYPHYGKIIAFLPAPKKISEIFLNAFVNNLMSSGLTSKDYAEQSNYVSFDIGVMFKPNPQEAICRFEWLHDLPY